MNEEINEDGYDDHTSDCSPNYCTEIEPGFSIGQRGTGMWRQLDQSIEARTVTYGIAGEDGRAVEDTSTVLP
jgi:hypothetical protein